MHKYHNTNNWRKNDRLPKNEFFVLHFSFELKENGWHKKTTTTTVWTNWRIDFNGSKIIERTTIYSADGEQTGEAFVFANNNWNNESTVKQIYTLHGNKYSWCAAAQKNCLSSRKLNKLMHTENDWMTFVVQFEWFCMLGSKLLFCFLEKLLFFQFSNCRKIHEIFIWIDIPFSDPFDC